MDFLVLHNYSFIITIAAQTYLYSTHLKGISPHVRYYNYLEMLLYKLNYNCRAP